MKQIKANSKTKKLNQILRPLINGNIFNFQESTFIGDEEVFRFMLCTDLVFYLKNDRTPVLQIFQIPNKQNISEFREIFKRSLSGELYNELFDYKQHKVGDQILRKTLSLIAEFNLDGITDFSFEMNSDGTVKSITFDHYTFTNTTKAFYGTSILSKVYEFHGLDLEGNPVVVDDEEFEDRAMIDNELDELLDDENLSVNDDSLKVDMCVTTEQVFNMTDVVMETDSTKSSFQNIFNQLTNSVHKFLDGHALVLNKVKDIQTELSKAKNDDNKKLIKWFDIKILSLTNWNKYIIDCYGELKTDITKYENHKLTIPTSCSIGIYTLNGYIKLANDVIDSIIVMIESISLGHKIDIDSLNIIDFDSISNKFSELTKYVKYSINIGNNPDLRDDVRAWYGPFIKNYNGFVRLYDLMKSDVFHQTKENEAKFLEMFLFLQNQQLMLENMFKAPERKDQPIKNIEPYTMSDKLEPEIPKSDVITKDSEKYNNWILQQETYSKIVKISDLIEPVLKYLSECVNDKNRYDILKFRHEQSIYDAKELHDWNKLYNSDKYINNEDWNKRMKISLDVISELSMEVIVFYYQQAEKYSLKNSELENNLTQLQVITNKTQGH